MTGLRLLPRAEWAPPGFHGRILHVDLSNKRLWVEAPGLDFYRLHPGGGLLGTRLLLDLAPPGIDPLAPEAPLIVASSVVAGFPEVALPRFSVVGKSPLTGGVGEARAEGPWGIALKRSGVDAIVIRGRAESPCYLLLEAGEVSIVTAAGIWGTDTAQATDTLCARHGNDAEVAVIGAAGERGVRFASIVSSRSFPAPRMGLGAVMGAKRLKAIVLAGGEASEPADRGRMHGLTESYAGEMPANPLSLSQLQVPGFGAWAGAGRGLEGYLGVENYRTSRVPEPSGLNAEAFVTRVAWDGGCPGCPNLCIKGIAAPGADPRASGLHQESVAALGPNLGIWDVDLALELNAGCHLWGVDPVSLGYVLSFVYELGARRLAPDEVVAAIGNGFGDGGATRRLAEAVAHRRGPLAWLGDGVARAAARLGPGTERFALHVKGLEMVGFDPRASAGQALAYAVSPIGPRYDIVEHDIDFDPVDGRQLFVEQAATLGVRGFRGMAELDDAKVRATQLLMDFWSGLDALDVCIFASAPTRPLSAEKIAAMVEAATGWPTDPDHISVWGRRRLELMRRYNLREGLTAAEDRLPDRFFEEPVDSGRHSGARLDRQEFASARALYYKLMRWDEAGVPPASPRP